MNKITPENEKEGIYEPSTGARWRISLGEYEGNFILFPVHPWHGVCYTRHFGYAIIITIIATNGR